jgi:hypothetical protein
MLRTPVTWVPKGRCITSAVIAADRGYAHNYEIQRAMMPAFTLALLQAWVPQGALTWNSVCWSLSVEAFFGEWAKPASSQVEDEHMPF